MSGTNSSPIFVSYRSPENASLLPNQTCIPLKTPMGFDEEREKKERLRKLIKIVKVRQFLSTSRNLNCSKKI